MIDQTKTIGTPETFNSAKIQNLLSNGLINNVSNLEKAIYSLEYLGQLKRAGLDFVFKGGSAVQVILQDKWARLSVDVDICCNVSEKELQDILSNIYDKFAGQAFAFKARSRVISGVVPFYLYIFEAPSIVMPNESRSCLLDVMGVKPNYPTTQTALRTPFYESEETITVPTVGALLGDKLSTIGPNTVGRNLVDSRNGVEYAKHFHDIRNLQANVFSFKDCCLAFLESVKLQSMLRGARFFGGGLL
ncbi:MAG: nucleotidyl transferase AbiEii/AbiGii toxin family protein [Nitrososphaerota archaeon]|nr:nucleotidyl transferase AbiEii/AbiGii toxin family protein [Nitrososphaerota archaeon]